MSGERSYFKKHPPRCATGFPSLLRLSAISVGIALIGMIILAFLAALILIKTEDPTGAIAPLSIVLICAASLASGFISHKLCKTSPVLSGLLSGAILAIFILVVALFLKNDSSASGGRVAMHLIPLPLSTLGSFLGSIKPKARRRTTIRRR